MRLGLSVLEWWMGTPIDTSAVLSSSITTTTTTTHRRRHHPLPTTTHSSSVASALDSARRLTNSHLTSDKLLQLIRNATEGLETRVLCGFIS